MRSRAASAGRARRRTRSPAILLVLAVAATVGVAATSHALVWPDVAERVERDLSAPDPATRKAAVRDLPGLGAKRGGPLALAALGDTDEDVRLAAADAAIQLRVAGATEAVASWLNAPDVRLRRKACEVARTLPNGRAVQPLARTLGDPDPEVRAAAAEALGNQTTADAVPPLLGRLDDPTPAVRIQVVAALSRLGDGRAVVPLVGKVQDSSPDVRQAVARALGDLGDARASSALILALRDANEDVRRDALASLGKLRAVDAVDSVVQFVTDRNSTLHVTALSTLGQIASPDAVRALVGALGLGDDSAAALERTPVRDALVSAGGAAVAPLRALLASSASAAEATSAAWVLGELQATNEAHTIVQALRGGALPAAAALHALAGAGTSADVPVVLEYLADPSPLVRGEALGAAGALLDPNHPDGRAVEPLSAALRDTRPSTVERARIASLLGRTGAPRAAAVLVDLTRAPDPALRVAAIDALGVLGPAGADDALLGAIESPDATVRLRAAVALAEAGGARARDALLTRLDGGDDVDRAAVLTALGGILSRVPTEAAVARLSQSLELAAGPERDAVLEALGRAPGPACVRVLAGLVRAPEVADRRQAASLLAAHGGDSTALSLARALVGDIDPTVRAQAAWSLGSLGDAADVAPLDALASGPDGDAAADAMAALGRIAWRLKATDWPSRILCPHVADPRPYTRSNALAGLALARARCGDGSAQRAALAGDPNDDVRAAAASSLARAPASDDARALDRCARTDPSGAVAARCRERARTPGRARATLLYAVPEGSATPRPGAAYAVLLGDGFIHAGTTDRRGAVFDPVVPEGMMSLRPPGVLAR